jgi:hypothetical protein
MSEISAASYCGEKRIKEDNGFNSLFLILILLCLCGNNNGFLGGAFGKNDCDKDNGFDGILPIILILCLCGGSF